MISFERFTELGILEDRYQLAMLQDYSQIRKSLRILGISDKELDLYIKSRIDIITKCEDVQREAALEDLIQYEKKTPKCGECGSAMIFEEVNNKPCNNIGHGYRSMLYCPNDLCASDAMTSRKSLLQLLRFYGLYSFKGKRAQRRSRPCTDKTKYPNRSVMDSSRSPSKEGCSGCGQT